MTRRFRSISATSPRSFFSFFVSPVLAASFAALLHAAPADRWSEAAGEWDVRIDGGGEIYQANLQLKLEGDGGEQQVSGVLRSDGRKARLDSAREEDGALVVEFATRRSGMPVKVILAFESVGGRLVGDIDFDSGNRVRSFEFEAERIGPPPAREDQPPAATDAKPKSTTVAASVKAPVAEPEATQRVTFRQEQNGYKGATDTEIWGVAPSKPLDRQGTMTADLNNGGGESQVLMKFSEIFGTSEGLIPPGSQIVSAKLTIVVFDPGTTVYLHRVLVPWDAAATWDRVAVGFTADDVEASRLRDGFSFGEINMDKQLVDFDVTGSVQKWSDGTPNYGWVFINTGGNGWDFYSSDWVEKDIRPVLEVEFKRPSAEEKSGRSLTAISSPSSAP